MTIIQKRIIGTLLLVSGIITSYFTQPNAIAYISGILVGIGFSFIVFAKNTSSKK